MIESKYFKIIPFASSDSKTANDKELISGDYWGVIKREHTYVLQYISGDHQGGQKEIDLTKTEFNQIKNAEITIEELLRIHNAG